MPTISANTPLARLLVSRGITQGTLAKAIGCGQGSISRLVNGRIKGWPLAVQVCDYLDPQRAEFNELHLLAPERFKDWEPTAQTATPADETQG